jgi:hypothetical protein
MNLDQLLDLPAYSLAPDEKGQELLRLLNELTHHHRSACPPYDAVLSAIGATPTAGSLDEVPMLPVSLFKMRLLQSVPPEQVVKTLTSSGTTGAATSRVPLDARTAKLQSKALVRIISEVVGRQRLPMILVDTPAVISGNETSARGAGVLGLMNFGHHHFFALRPDMSLDHEGLVSFLDQYGGQPFLIFGFTFMVWAYLLEEIAAAKLDLSQGILLHSGGWKRLEQLRISNDVFKQRWREATGLERINSFYGMAEQVGSVFLEGNDGLLHTPNFADVIVRDPVTWEASPPGIPGVVQVLSALPWSYPGHSLLTEDWGVIHTLDAAGEWRGKAFSILGRLPRTDLRGCSDVHAFSAHPVMAAKT